MSGDPIDLEQVLHDAEQGWALSTDARMALAAEVRRLRAEVVRARHPVSLGPVRAPDYTMRVNFSHEPLPDLTPRMTVIDCLLP